MKCRVCPRVLLLSRVLNALAHNITNLSPLQRQLIGRDPNSMAATLFNPLLSFEKIIYPPQIFRRKLIGTVCENHPKMSHLVTVLLLHDV